MKRLVLLLILGVVCLSSKNALAYFQLPHIYNGHIYTDVVEDTYTTTYNGQTYLHHATYYYNKSSSFAFYWSGAYGGCLSIWYAASYVKYYENITLGTGVQITEYNNGYPKSFGVNNDYWQPSPMDTSDLHTSQNIVIGSFNFPANNFPVLSVTAIPSEGGNIAGTYGLNGSFECNVNQSESCQLEFSLNTQISLTAYPNCGWTFDHWDDGTLCYADNPWTVVMDGSKEVDAVFQFGEAGDFIFPVLAEGVTDPLQNTINPIGNGWHGYGVGELSAEYGHLGQDYIMDSTNGDGDAAGEPVYAIANGTIVEVMNNPDTLYGWCDNDDHGWGPVVVMRHENQAGFNTTDSIIQPDTCNTETNPTVIYSLYGHLSKASIQGLYIGQKIAKGTQIGVVGSYGVDQDSWSTNHPHFELKDEAGFDEGAWYFNESNWGVCPESTIQACTASGIGTAYSYSPGFAPHRYEPGIFIPAN